MTLLPSTATVPSFGRASIVACAAALGSILLLAAPAGAERRSAPELPERSPEALRLADQAAEHMREEAYALAAPVLTKLLEAEPAHGNAWYQLGYCALAGGEHGKAVECWTRSAEIGHLPAESRYNLACALALGGERERALDALEGAVERGYVQLRAMAQDPDLSSLHEEPRFRELLKGPSYSESAGGTPVAFPSEGEWMVFGQLYPTHGEDPKAAPCLLLFHQAGSNHAEYFPIAPRLAEMGFTCLTIDARGGGSSYGRDNETVATHGERGGGAEAYLDFLAALRYLDEEGFTGNRSLWGSSYSAGRLFAVLAEKPERVVSSLAFSPGRAFTTTGENGEPSWASRTSVPIFYAAPLWEYDNAALERFESIPGDDNWLYVPSEGGAHGSAMLRPDRNPKGYEAAWEEVTAFLDAHAR